MRIIANDFLLDDHLLEVAKEIHNYDDSIDIYLHISGGEKKVNGGIYGTKIIIYLNLSLGKMLSYQ